MSRLSNGADARTAMTTDDRSTSRSSSKPPAAATDVVRCRWTSDEPPASQVIHAVAAASGVPPDRLDPLYETVDPDALNRLFPSDAASEAAVHFRYAGHDVTVRSDGIITVTPPRLEE